MAILECVEASFGYDANIVLSDVDFSLCGGEYLCILGENGAGKSTLIKGILGLIAPAKGKVLFGEGLKSHEIGYMPQQMMINSNFPASVLEVVLSGRINSMGARPFYNSADKKDALEKLELMGMKGYEKRSYRDLSGGQKQRVLLARAMCAAKKLILLDEPVSGLDPAATAELYDIIKKINSEYKMTVIMVSHDTKAAVSYASHILHLSHTQLFYGTKDEYVSSRVGLEYLKGADIGC
ncbi:MAG: metal ABC transporter ATP-binding protein [Lachnospiraceae bacterium]|nr:metal ABC transporter ATP-binding protein [Lachnospiraceae bacterium]